MPETDPPDLFTTAGLVLDAEPVPKRQRKPRKPTPAQRAGSYAVKAPAAYGPRRASGSAAGLSSRAILARRPCWPFPSTAMSTCSRK